MSGSEIFMRVFDETAIVAAARLFRDAKTDYIDTDDIEDLHVKEIANVTTKGTLDMGDFYTLISNESLLGWNVNSFKALRSVLGFPVDNPNGVRLIFSVKDGVAITTIIPTLPDIDPLQAVDVHIGGLWHPAGVYGPGAIDFAIKENRVVVLVDSIGVGGSAVSKDDTMDYDKIVSILSVIESWATPGKIRYLFGHSLGSLPVRHAFWEKVVSGRQIAERYILIGMVPGPLEERAGFRMNPWFSKVSTPGVLFGNLIPNSARRFFGNHSENEQKLLEERAQRQRYPINLFGFSDALFEIANRPLVDFIGNDPSLIVVMTGDDHVMELENCEEWKRRGVIFLTNGDHSCIAGEETSKRYWEELRMALHDRRDHNMPRLEPSAAMARIKTEAAFAFELDSKLNGNVGLKGDLSFGLGRYFDAMLGAGIFIGGFDKVNVPARVHLDIHITPGETTRFGLFAGAEGAIDLNGLNPTGPFTYGGVCYNLFNVLEAQIQGGAIISFSGAPIVPTLRTTISFPVEP